MTAPGSAAIATTCPDGYGPAPHDRYVASHGVVHDHLCGRQRRHGTLNTWSVASRCLSGTVVLMSDENERTDPPRDTPGAAQVPMEGSIVPTMTAHASAVTKDGHLLVLRLPDGAAVVCDWVQEGTSGDVTGWFADLALIGWKDASEAAAERRPEPAETVQVAHLRLDPPMAAALASVTYVHLPTQDTVEVPLAQALSFAGRGINVQITTGVAADIAATDTPDAPVTADS